MSGFDAAADAKNTVKDAKSHDKEGADKAYQTLQGDIHKEVSNPALTTQQKKDYFDSVSKELKAQGLLPELSLEWAKGNAGALGKDGKISKQSISDFESRQYTDFNGNGGLDPLSKSFADTLTSRVGNDSLSTKDLASAEVKERAQSANRQTLEPLYQGTPPLLQILDGSADGGKLDGHVSEKDLNSYLNFAKQIQPPAADGPYSAQNQKFVQDLVNGKIQVAGDDGKMKDAPKDFNTGDIAKLAGISDVPIAEAMDKNKAYGDQAANFTQARTDRAGNGPDVSDTAPSTTSTPDGSPTAAFDKLNPEQQKKVIDGVRTSLIDESKAQSGNGYINIAARLLGNPSGNDSDPKIKALSDALSKLNDGKLLHPGDPTLTADNLVLFLGQNQAFNVVYQKALLNAADNFGSGTTGS